ncbi:MAG: hypothetical protein VR72_15700 [Clostridiaceae bacterium BRH_c20a]|nr:MAG: hypothetical protein VR72_15700 [Clostridiaceae bacterium BRH_c20a]
MSEIALLLTLISLFLVLVLLKVPVAFALASSSLLIIVIMGKPPILVIERMYASLEYFPLLAIPFFMLVGVLMSTGVAMEQIIQVSRVFVGHFQGALAHINILVSMLFAGVSGTSTSDTAGIGSILIPAMHRSGFPLGFSVAITAASSTIGTIIPPSVLMVIYGSISGVSISKLFLAGAIPGVLVGFVQMVYAYMLAKKNNWPANERASLKEIGSALKNGTLPMMIPVIIIGGIIGGIFTATEAGAIATLYALILGIFYREITLTNIGAIINKAARTVALPLFAIAASTLFGWLIAFLKAPNIATKFVLSITNSPQIGLMFIMLVFFIVGMFIDGVPAIIIFSPVANAIGNGLGIPEMQIAIVVCMTVSLGLITPPFGLCLLLASKIGKISVVQASIDTIPFVLLFIIVVLIVIFFPAVSLWLPSLLN